MARMFGTDGVRGVANKDLSCELALKIGKAGAYVLTSEVHQPRILLGRDTRLSGDMLSAALTAGICSVGGDVIDVGVIPTPAMAYLARAYEADAAVMVSASHNTMEYNGIKWFDGKGFKLSDGLEDEIEKLIKEAEIIDESTLSDDVVNIGSYVKVYDYDLEEEDEYQLVGSTDVDPDNNKISYESPIGAALLHKKVGDKFTVEIPAGTIDMKIISIHR